VGSEEVQIGRPPGSLTIARAEGVGSPAEQVTWTLQLPGLRAVDDVWLAEWEGGPQRLAHFFAELAADWREWEGTKEWAGGDGELRLAATHDGVGHVELFVAMRAHWSGQPPFPDEWATSGVVVIEPGSLDHVACRVAALLGVAEP
jgi:hypothetical protein